MKLFRLLMVTQRYKYKMVFPQSPNVCCMPTSSWGQLIGGRGGTSLLVDKNHGWLSSSLLTGHLKILFPWFAHCVSKGTQLLRRSLLSVSLYTGMLWTLVWTSLCTVSTLSTLHGSLHAIPVTTHFEDKLETEVKSFSFRMSMPRQNRVLGSW